MISVDEKYRYLSNVSYSHNNDDDEKKGYNERTSRIERSR